MAQGFAAEVTGVLDGTLNPPARVDGRIVGGRVRMRRATLDLSLANVAKNIGDTNVLCRIPAGEAFLFGILNPSVGLGAAATVAIGNATTAGKYRAAAIQNTAEAKEMFGLSSAMDDVPLAAYEDVLLTVAAAALPGAGIVNVLIFTTGR
jgi:hypothetical protein